MKHIILLLVFLSSFNSFYGQNVEWVKFFSGNSIESVVDMTIDSEDNIILLGFYSQEIDFDPGPDTLKSLISDTNNIFIEKLTSDGNLIWVKTIGGAGFDSPGSIEVDNNDNIVLSGQFVDSLDIDPGVDTFMVNATNGNYYFLKLDSSGNFKGVWQTLNSTQPFTRPFTIKENGNVIVSTRFSIEELDSAMQVIPTGFILGVPNPSHIITDNENNIIVEGATSASIDLDPGPDTFLLHPLLNIAISYISKYDSSGNFIWANAFESNSGGNFPMRDITTDQSGNIIYSLNTRDSLYMTNNIYDTCLTSVNATQGGCVLKLSSTGTLKWSEFINSSSGGSICYGVASDYNNRIYVNVNTDSDIDFDPGPDTFIVSGPQYLTCIQVLDSNNLFMNCSKYTGTPLKMIRKLKVNSTDALYAAGQYHGTCNFDSLGSISSASQNYDDGFIVKYNSSILDVPSKYIEVEKLSIFPNPGTDKIYLKMEKVISGNASVRIINGLGTTVWNSRIENSELKNGYNVMAPELSNGIYTIVISTENKTFSGRYIRQN